MQQLGRFAPPSPKSSNGLSRRRKAALIIQMLFRDGSGIPLTRMPEKLQAALAHELGAIRLVDKATVKAVAAEFLRELDAIGLVAPGSTLQALEALGDKISPTLADRLRTDIMAAQIGDPWPMVTALSEDNLVTLMERESTHVGAVVLSKLPVSKAASVLGKLLGERARRISFGMSQTSAIAPDAVLKIGKALMRDYCKTSRVAFNRGPDARLGAILNTSPTTTREDVLKSLNGEDQKFADDVRRNIFTFADIATRIIGTDIPVCIRSVDADRLNIAIAVALAGSDDEAAGAGAEYILSNMSQRMASQIRESVEELGHVKRKTGEAAMNEVTTAIRELVDGESIRYQSTDDEDE
jgi:flagellar motor switch protein FliG